MQNQPPLILGNPEPSFFRIAGGGDYKEIQFKVSNNSGQPIEFDNALYSWILYRENSSQEWDLLRKSSDKQGPIILFENGRTSPDHFPDIILLLIESDNCQLHKLSIEGKTMISDEAVYSEVEFIPYDC